MVSQFHPPWPVWTTFKVYPNGRVSGYLDRIPIGSAIDVFRKGSNERNPAKYLCIIAFGVGITESLPLAEAELRKPDAQHVHLIWQSRTKGDTFWADRIGKIASPISWEIPIELHNFRFNNVCNIGSRNHAAFFLKLLLFSRFLLSLLPNICLASTEIKHHLYCHESRVWQRLQPLNDNIYSSLNNMNQLQYS